MHQNYTIFSLTKRNDIPILEVQEKRIYMHYSDDFRDEVMRLLEDESIDAMIIDLSKVSIMNSAGLGVLIAVQHEMDKRKGKLWIVGLQPLMREIFERMKLPLLFEIGDSVDSALAALIPPEM